MVEIYNSKNQNHDSVQLSQNVSQIIDTLFLKQHLVTNHPFHKTCINP